MLAPVALFARREKHPCAGDMGPWRSGRELCLPADLEAWGPEPTREGEAPCGRGQAVTHGEAGWASPLIQCHRAGSGFAGARTA